MKIRIIQIGKIKEKYLEEGIQEYVKRLKPYIVFEILEFREITPTRTFTKERAILEEGKMIMESLHPTDYVIVLDEKGKSFDSVDFAENLKKFMDRGEKIVLVLGGPFGLSEEVKSRANLLLSLSKMTFTHQMVRLFLMEQIYRAICIIKGKEYHN